MPSGTLTGPHPRQDARPAPLPCRTAHYRRTAPCTRPLRASRSGPFREDSFQITGPPITPLRRFLGIGAGASTRLEDTDPVPQTISQTSRCVGERTEAAGNDDRRPAVTATRMVFAAYNEKIVPWGCPQADGPTGPGISGGEDCHREAKIAIGECSGGFYP